MTGREAYPTTVEAYAILHLMPILAVLGFTGLLLCAQISPTAKLLHEAEEKIQAERFDVAEGLLQEAVRQAPANIDALYRLAYVQYRRRKLAPARSTFMAVVKRAPPAHNSRYFLGRIALLQNNPKEAIEWLEPVVASGSNFDAASQLAKAYTLAGEHRKAIKALHSATNQTPWDGSLYYRIGQLYQKTGEQELARDAFETSTRLKSATTEDVEIMLRSSQLLASGKPLEAAELSAQILKRSVVEPGSLVALGVIFGNANLPSEALKAFERAAMLDGSLFQAQFNYGLVLLKLNRTADALAPLRRAFELLPQSQEAAMALGLAATMNQRYTEAVPPLEAAWKRDSANTRLGGLVATAYLRTGAAARAIPILQGLTRRRTDDPAIRLLLVEAFDTLGDREKASEEALQLQKDFPGSPQAQMAAAQQLVHAGKYEQAGAAFEAVLKLSPGQREAELGLADSLQKSGSYQASLEHYDAAGPSLPARLGQARSLVALKQFEKAREVLESALPEFPADVTLRLELSRVYARLGQAGLAAEQAKMIEQLRAK
jgi:tetratricopeptide (TPR) repeat protein